MGVLDKLNQIKSCKEDIKQAIEDKGVDMTDVAFTEYAEKIGEIQTGGGSGDYVESRNNMTTYTNKDITSVDDYLFAKCPELTTVKLPNCTYIGEESFKACRKLSSINIPNTREIMPHAFQQCDALTSIDLPLCEDIQNTAFFECVSLSSIDLPEIKEINQECFRYCTNLQSISLPKCEYLDWGAFDGCDLLSINLPNVWKTESNTFSNNHNLQVANLPVCQRLQGEVFENDESLAAVHVPNCFYMLGATFRNCSSLQVVDLSKTYTCYLEDAWAAFENTPMAEGNGFIYIHAAHLSHFQEDTNWSMYSDNFVAVGDPNKPLLAFEDGRMYGDAEEIDNNFTDFLGIDKSSLTSIDLPNVRRLYNNDWGEGIDFRQCDNLQEVNLPMCESIGNNTFWDCNALTSINLPMCESIGDNAFYHCDVLTSINLPMCESIGGSAFSGCHNLKTITVGTSLSTVCKAGWLGLDYDSFEAIYVPSALVDAYKSAQYWSDYADKIFGI